MKVRLEYEYKLFWAFPFWATARFEGSEKKHIVSCCGNSYQEAKKRVLESVRATLPAMMTPVPAPEEIEVG